MFPIKSIPRSAQLHMKFYQLLMTWFMYLNMNLRGKLCNSFKNCMNFTLREVRNQNLLLYLQVCSRCQGETEAGPCAGLSTQRLSGLPRASRIPREETPQVQPQRWSLLFERWGELQFNPSYLLILDKQRNFRTWIKQTKTKWDSYTTDETVC